MLEMAINNVEVGNLKDRVRIVTFCATCNSMHYKCKHFSINATFYFWNLEFLNLHLIYLKLPYKDFTLSKP